MKKLAFLLLAPLLLLTGCASIVGKDAFPVTINSNPDGANIAITDERGKKIFNGVTPTTVTLAAGEAYFHGKVYNVTFSKPGFQEQHAVIKSGLSGWYFGNIVFGGLIGILIVDPITGKMWKLPADCSANLSPQLSSGKEPALKIMTLKQVPENMRKNMVRIK